tara:strand:+ start:52 stop:858 length:807 start_codon:yes stop_codon:yes gene_type:complete
MTAIQPVENELNKLIKREDYRAVLAEISTSYEEMQTFMDNLEQDINSISDFIQKLQDNEAQGFDVGTSKQTLLFQKITLKNDLDWYTAMKETYLRKIYEDLWNYTSSIIDSAIEIEPNPLKKPVDEIKQIKIASCRPYADGNNYTMSEIYILLSTTERNLFELSSDIAGFNQLIQDATEKMKRGFAVGNLMVNLQSQQTKLTLEFKGYIIRLEQFLQQNRGFAKRCLNRVKTISNEIVSEQELEEQEKEKEQEQENNAPSNENPNAEE